MPKQHHRIYLVSADLQSGALLRVHPAGGYKQCAKKGLHRAWVGPYGAVCPGCDRVCMLPDGFTHGKEFLVVARPKD